MPSYYNSTAQTKAEIMASHTEKYAHGGRVGFKAGTDKDWIQKATKNMRKDKPCTGKKFGSKVVKKEGGKIGYASRTKGAIK
jgi:hypothetical protein